MDVLMNNSEHVIKLIQFTIKTYNNSPHILRHALFKHFMSNERAFRNKLRSGHPTCQKLICDMRSMTARQHDSMTAWQGDISWQEVTSHSYKPDTRNQRGDRAATAQSDHCMSPLVSPLSPCVPMSWCHDNIFQLMTISRLDKYIQRKHAVALLCKKYDDKAIIFTPW